MDCFSVDGQSRNPVPILILAEWAGCSPMPPARNALVHRGTAVARDRGKSMRAIAGMLRRLNSNCDLQNQHAENQQQLTLSQVPVSYLGPEFLNSSCSWCRQIECCLKLCE